MIYCREVTTGDTADIFLQLIWFLTSPSQYLHSQVPIEVRCDDDKKNLIHILKLIITFELAI
jgi:hypothetical protein